MKTIEGQKHVEYGNDGKMDRNNRGWTETVGNITRIKNQEVF